MDRGDWGAASEPAPPCATSPSRRLRRARRARAGAVDRSFRRRVRSRKRPRRPRRRRARPTRSSGRRGTVAQADILNLDSSARGAEARARRDEARAILEAADDDLGLAHYWRSRGYDLWGICRCAESGEAWSRGIGHARAIGADRIAWELRSYVLSGLVLGATPVSAALPKVEAALDQAREGSLEEAAALRASSQLLAFSGSIDEGRARIDQGVQTFRDAGLLVTACGWSMSQSEIERRAGDTRRADPCAPRGPPDTRDPR